MRETLPHALALMFGHEGGYSNHPNDPGGPTKYGITHRTLAAHRGVRKVEAWEVKALSLREAEEIYRKSYWLQSGGDLLPKGLDYMAFDFGVNSGPSRSVKSLQKVLGVRQDGVVGLQTADAAAQRDVAELIEAYGAERMRFLRSLRTWKTFGRGWTIRVTGKDPKGYYKDAPGVIGHAADMARGAAPKAAVQPKAPEGKADPKDRSITDIVKEPEAWGPLTGVMSGLGSLLAGSGPVQWALAAGIVVGVGIGVYYFVKRARAD